MYMEKEPFYRNNRMSYRLEGDVQRFKSFDEFEQFYSREMLDDDTQIGEYLEDLLIKYDKPASATSFRAHLAHSYVGNIINFKKNNPSRDALISICLALGADVEETQYLLKYAGQAPLYVRRRRDVIIWFGLMKHQTIEEVNDKILSHGLKPLYRED